MNHSEDVAIFWDYENCSVPSNASGCTIANSIATLSRPFGSIKLFRAYLEIADQLPLSRSVALRSELQSSGVSLIDCPHNGRKEVADKMILVDMLTFAIDNPAPCTIVIISGDRDFAYAMSVLKLRRYRIVLVTHSNAHATLTAQSSIWFDWKTTILNPCSNTTAPSPGTFPESQVPSLVNKHPSQEIGGGTDETDIEYYLRKRGQTSESVPRPPLNGHPRSQPTTYYRGDINATDTTPNTSSAFSQSAPNPSSNNAPITNTHGRSFQRKPVTLRNPNSNLPVVNRHTRHDSGPYMHCHLPNPLMSEALLSTSGDSEGSATDASSETAASVQTALFEPSSPVVPPPAPVWLNGAQWEVGSQSGEDSSQDSGATQEDESLTAVTLPSSDEHLLEPLSPEAPSTQLNPEKFGVLVRVLQEHRRKGNTQPLRSAVALQIASHGLATEAGVATFGHYVDLAVQNGVVEIGEEAGRAWIGLPTGEKEATTPSPPQASITSSNMQTTSPPIPSESSIPDLVSDESTGDIAKLEEPAGQQAVEVTYESERVTTPLPDLPKTRSKYSAGLPGFSLASMARLQAIDLNCDNDEPPRNESSTRGRTEQPRTHATSATSTTSSLPHSPAASYATAPTTPQQGVVKLSTNAMDQSSPDPIPPPATSVTSRVVPPILIPLVASLQTRLAHGHSRPLLREVGFQIKECEEYSREKGMVTFVQHVNMAAKEGIIELGVREGDPCIVLKPEWHGAVSIQQSTSASTTYEASEKPISSVKELSSTDGVTATTPPDSAASTTMAEAMSPTTSTETSAHTGDSDPPSIEPKSATQISDPHWIEISVPEPTTSVRRSEDRLVPTLDEPLPATTPQSVDSSTKPIFLVAFPPSKASDEVGQETASSLKAKLPLSPFEPRPSQPTIPPHFEALVLTLQELRKEKNLWPLRTKVALLLFKNYEPDIFTLAGASDFDEYVELARQEAIVETCGKDAKAFMGLRLKWFDAIPSRMVPSGTQTALPSMVASDDAKTHKKTGAYASTPQVPEVPLPSSSEDTVPGPSTPKKVIPAPFAVLVQTLEEHRRKGVEQPLRGTVALQIGKGGTYQKAGVAKFSQYVDLAVQQGIVKLGGSMGAAWMSLQPAWYDAVVGPDIELQMQPQPPPRPPPQLKTQFLPRLNEQIHPRRIPPLFVPLVQSLQSFRAEGVWGPAWVLVAPSVVKSGVVERAGVKKFGQYVALAVQVGIVESGGNQCEEWLRLMPDWYYSIV